MAEFVVLLVVGVALAWASDKTAEAGDDALSLATMIASIGVTLAAVGFLAIEIAKGSGAL